MANSYEGEMADKADNVTAVGGNTNSAVDSAEDRQAAGKNGAGGAWRWFALLLIIVLLALVGAVGWYGFQLYQRVDSVSTLVEQQAAQVAATGKQLSAEKTARGTTEAELAARIADTELALTAQAQAIAELSSFDRDQWVYAELEYLVRLANQRLLTERRPQGALALLEAADTLLASMDDAGALSVRRVFARDISALRLVETVDREGIYSRLGALTPSILGLAAVPSENLSELLADSTVDSGVGVDVDAQGLENDRDETVETANSRPAVTWYHQLWLNAKAALSRFSRDHFHVRYRDVAIEPLLSTDQEQWLRFDMAINVANAQQALLRDEQEIYRASLTTIGNHLQRYFPGSRQARTLMAEVEALGEVNVKQDLPDISASIKALRQLQGAARGTDVGGVQP